MSDAPKSPSPEPEGTPDQGTGGDAPGDRAKAVVEAAERAAAEILAEAKRDAERRVAEARERADAAGHERVEMMSALSDSLLEQATTVKRQADVLIDALDRVIATLERAVEEPARPLPGPPPRPAEARRVAARPPAPPPRPAPPPAAPRPSPRPAADPEAHARALEAIRERISRGAEAKPPAPPTPSIRPQDPQRPPRKPVSEGTAEGARLLATQMAVAGSTRAEILVRLRKEFGIQDPEPIVDGVVGGPGEGPGGS